VWTLEHIRFQASRLRQPPCGVIAKIVSGTLKTALIQVWTLERAGYKKVVIPPSLKDIWSVAGME